VHPVSACLQLNEHNSCGYNDIIPETKNEYDIETMVGLWFMMLNATFNNISVISWQSVLMKVQE
jgi:hypothetical protein